MQTNDIHQLIASRHWLHRFELAPGVWSPGRRTVNAQGDLTRAGVPEDLRGKRLLDVGAADGGYSFEFARRGADVLAIDIQDPDTTGFPIANMLAPKPVEHRILSVYDLSPDEVGKFDIVWYWGVYYHLREPLWAFRNLYHVLNTDGLLCFAGAILDGAEEAADPRLGGCREHLEALSHVPLTL
jgi:2-polyprenyl-3-methyl-5-hydroxy-6-metoxy-1,4-benzoquinol methylase